MDIQKLMTPRLMATAKFVEAGSTVVDVGTDHAYIPIWLSVNGVCSSAVATDINLGPILRARENIKKFGMESKIQARLSDGLAELAAGEADTVVIAGMGGILINRILAAAKHLYSSVRRYVIQPMTAVEETRKFLEQNGFFIENECLAKEDDKIYTVLCVCRGQMRIEKSIYYHIGKKLIDNRDPLLPELLDGKLYEIDKAVCSMRFAKGEEAARKRERFIDLRKEMEKIKETCALW